MIARRRVELATPPHEWYAEHQSDGRAQRLVEAQARVACQPGKHGACARAVKCLCEMPAPTRARQPQFRHAQWMMREAQYRPQCLPRNSCQCSTAGCSNRCHASSIASTRARLRQGRAPTPPRCHRRADAPAARRRGSTPGRAPPAERTEKRRTRRERMHRRASVMQKSRQRQRQCACGATRHGSASNTSTRNPPCASTIAAASPFGPDPITHARFILSP